MSDDWGIRIVAGYYGIFGVLSLILAALLVFVGLALPFSVTAVPMGVLGVAVAVGIFALIPLILGIFLLALAWGLWTEQTWGLWIGVGVGVFSALGSLALVLAAASLPSSQFVPWWEFVPGLIIGGGSALYLFARRDSFG